MLLKGYNMQDNSNKDSQLMDRAVCSNHLSERSNINSNYGINDFDAWVDGLIGALKFSSVLDICCGTGNQLVKYAGINKKTKIIGVDLSKESLQVADKRLQALEAESFTLKAVSMEDMFADAELMGLKYDLISCFYGLYYSKEVKTTLDQMVNHLSGNGNVLIVGPYGNNNATLFNILQRHFTLPELVLSSSTSFMEEIVLPCLRKKMLTRVETFCNPVRFPDPKTVSDYWRASTFFSPQHEMAVIKDIESHFAEYGEFVMEKHVMACLGSAL
jgi:SAM-dependent methyltransferase